MFRYPSPLLRVVSIAILSRSISAIGWQKCTPFTHTKIRNIPIVFLFSTCVQWWLHLWFCFLGNMGCILSYDIVYERQLILVSDVVWVVSGYDDLWTSARLCGSTGPPPAGPTASPFLYLSFRKSLWLSGNRCKFARWSLSSAAESPQSKLLAFSKIDVPWDILWSFALNICTGSVSKSRKYGN